MLEKMKSIKNGNYMKKICLVYWIKNNINWKIQLLAQDEISMDSAVFDIYKSLYYIIALL
jgi:hypothetical protein